MYYRRLTVVYLRDSLDLYEFNTKKDHISNTERPSVFGIYIDQDKTVIQDGSYKRRGGSRSRPPYEEL